MNENMSFTSSVKSKIESMLEIFDVLPTRAKLAIILMLTSGAGTAASSSDLDKKADALFLNDDTKIENVLNKEALSSDENNLPGFEETNLTIEDLQDTILIGDPSKWDEITKQGTFYIGTDPVNSKYVMDNGNRIPLEMPAAVTNLIDNKWNNQYSDRIGSSSEIKMAHAEINATKPVTTTEYEVNCGRGIIRQLFETINYYYFQAPLNYFYILGNSSKKGNVSHQNTIPDDKSNATVLVIIDKDKNGNPEKIVSSAILGCGNFIIVAGLEITEVKPEVIIKEVKGDTVYVKQDTIKIPCPDVEPKPEVDPCEKPIKEETGGFCFEPKLEVGVNLTGGPDGRDYHGLSVHRNAVPENYIDAYYIDFTDEKNQSYTIGLSWSEKDGKFIPGGPLGENGALSGTIGSSNPQFITVRYGEGKSKTFNIPWNSGEGEVTFDPFLWEDYIASKLGPNFLVNLGAEIRHSDAPGWYGEAGVSASVYPKNIDNTAFNVYLEVGKDFKFYKKNGQVGIKFLSPTISSGVKKAFEPGTWGIEYGIGADMSLEVLNGLNVGMEIMYKKYNDKEINIGNYKFDAKGEDRWEATVKLIF